MRSTATFFGQPEVPNISLTENGAMAYGTTMDTWLDFFATAGSVYNTRLHSKKQLKTSENTEELKLFKTMWSSNEQLHKILSMKLLFWLRNIPRDSKSLPGAGNRSGFRNILNWLATHDSKWVIANIEAIPCIGRWDDLEVLFGTPCENKAIELWASAITSDPQNGLACKWFPRKGIVNSKVRSYLQKSPKAFRKLLVAGTQVVEQQMCKNNWGEIDYSKVPSVAMSRSNAAFKRHDLERFTNFNVKVASCVDPNVKINAGTLYPHDIVRGLLCGGDKLTLRNQWNALPNFLQTENGDIRCIAVADTSGSMSCVVGGKVQAVHVSQAIAAYVSDKIGKNSKFYKKYIQFAGETQFTTWVGKEIDEIVGDDEYFNGSVDNTNIERCLLTILQECQKYKLQAEDCPNMLLIVSDMQFDASQMCAEERPVEAALKQYDRAGIARPRIVYWNVKPTSNKALPTIKNERGVCIASGFSPSFLKVIFENKEPETMTSLQVMLDTVKDFHIKIPE